MGPELEPLTLATPAPVADAVEHAVRLAAQAEARSAAGALLVADELFRDGLRRLRDAGWGDDSDPVLDLHARWMPVRLALAPTAEPIEPALLGRILARPAAEDSAVSRRLFALAAMSSWLSGTGTGLERAAMLARRAWGDGAYLADGLASDRASYALVATLTQLGEDAAALSLLDHALAAAGRDGLLRTEATIRGMRGAVLLAAGELEAALLDLDAATGVEGGDPLASRASPLPFLVYACALAGELDRARAAIARPVEPGPSALAGAFVARARLNLAEGRAEAAAALAAEAAALDEVGGIAWASGWRGVAAEAALALGDLTTAAELAEQERALLERWRFPTAKRVENAILRSRLGAPDADRELRALREEIEPSRFQRALLDERLAELAEQDDPDAEERLLLDARDAAEGHGMPTLVSRVDERLARLAEGRARRPQSLTRAEARVARLARDGLSNREIGRRLFVTPKTVEFHLSSAYRKLGISSRRELPAVEI